MDDSNPTNDVVEITPDDFDGKQDTPSTAPSADDTKPEVAKVADDPAKGDDTPAPSPAPTDGKADDDADSDNDDAPQVDKPEDKPLGKAEERKQQLNVEIRDLVAQRNALKSEVEKANAEVYQPATEDELTAEGMNSLEAKVEAMRQQQELEKYNTQVSDAQLTIGTEARQVLQDFEWANEDSPSYDKELATEAAALLEANLIIDPNTNQVIGSNFSPYQIYKSFDRATKISATKGQVAAQAATEQQLANADTNSSAAPPSSKPKDPVIALWESDD